MYDISIHHNKEIFEHTGYSHNSSIHVVSHFMLIIKVAIKQTHPTSYYEVYSSNCSSTTVIPLCLTQLIPQPSPLPPPPPPQLEKQPNKHYYRNLVILNYALEKLTLSLASLLKFAPLCQESTCYIHVSKVHLD